MSDAWALLQPFSDAAKDDFELALLLGRVDMALGRFDDSIAVFRAVLEKLGMNILVLNELGESQARLGLKDEALATWKRSLDTDSNQPALREKMTALQKKFQSAPAPR